MLNKYWQLTVCAIMALSAICTVGFAESQAIPGCIKPSAPSIPSDAPTSKERLVEAKASLDRYLETADDYLVCLKNYERSFGEDITTDAARQIVREHNLTVDEMYLAGDEFNVALRKFNLRATP